MEKNAFKCRKAQFWPKMTQFFPKSFFVRTPRKLCDKLKSLPCNDNILKMNTMNIFKAIVWLFKKNAILWSTQHKHGKCRGVYSSEIRLTHGWAFGRGSHRTIAGCYMCALKKTLVCLWYFRRRFWCRFQKNIHPWGNLIEQYWQRIPKNKLRH